MINQCTASCSYMYHETLMQEEHPCESPPPIDLDVDHIIKENESSLHYENTYISRKKWSLKIREGIILIIDHSVSSFSNKLIKINCGSIYEKRLFLSAISRRITDQPFESIENILASFVIKIQSIVARYAEKKIERTVNTGSKNYLDLRKIISKKAKETLLEESTMSELTSSISNKISEFHQTKYIEKTLDQYIDLFLECRLVPHIDTKKVPFTTFISSYRDHLEENHHYFMSKFIELFCDILHGEEYHMSLLFDTFHGHMIYHKHSECLRSIFSESLTATSDTSCLGTVVRGINSHRYPNKWAGRFFLDSKVKMKERMEKLLMGNRIIVLYGDVITTCNKEIMEKIVDSSVKEFKLCVDSYVKSLHVIGEIR